jgi:uncharacterized protein YbaP (TraB family)
LRAVALIGIEICAKSDERDWMKYKSLFVTLASGLLFCTTTTSCAKPAPTKAAAPAKPALWKLADADTTIYLFGTIHVLPDGYQWRTKAFDAAAAKSDTLVLEVADLGDTTKTAEVFTRLAMSPNLPPVLDRVPADKRAGLKTLIDKVGFPPSALAKFESWAVAITLAGGVLKDLDLSPDNGVERKLTDEFSAAKKPIIGLETTELQLGIFDKLPQSAQDMFLAGLADEVEDPKAEFDAMLGAWAKGDDKAIATTFDDELRQSPELTDALLRNRNANWTAWLTKRLDTPGTVMVAVGAGHLVGADSVQAMLAKQGVKVTRVQ